MICRQTPACQAAHRPGGLDRRSEPLRSSAQARGLPRTGLLGAFQRRAPQPRQHHQDGQRPRPPVADRGGVELPLQGPHRAPGPATPGAAVRADPKHGLEGPTEADQAVRRPARAWRTGQRWPAWRWRASFPAYCSRHAFPQRIRKLVDHLAKALAVNSPPVGLHELAPQIWAPRSSNEDGRRLPALPVVYRSCAPRFS